MAQPGTTFGSGYLIDALIRDALWNPVSLDSYAAPSEQLGRSIYYKTIRNDDGDEKQCGGGYPVGQGAAGPNMVTLAPLSSAAQ